MTRIGAMFLFLGLLLSPWGAWAQKGYWSAEGVIGDYAPRSRIFQVGGTSFRFPSHAVVEGPRSERMSVEGLKGGMLVRVEGIDLLGRGAGKGLGIHRVLVLGDQGF